MRVSALRPSLCRRAIVVLSASVEDSCNHCTLQTMNLMTEEIPRGGWASYLSSLSRQYQGWRLTIEVLSLGLGDQLASDGLPLQGLSLETRGSESGDVLIEAGHSIDEFMIHHVDHPLHVRMAVTQPGAEANLQVVSRDGTVTLLYLRRQRMLPPAAAQSPGADARDSLRGPFAVRRVIEQPRRTQLWA
jgi:hypothetical protein